MRIIDWSSDVCSSDLHIFDSLAVVPWLRTAGLPQHAQVSYMGSGAGLPGIILAMCQPNWQITCVDAVEKKTVFIRQAAGVLGLGNVQAEIGGASCRERVCLYV